MYIPIYVRMYMPLYICLYVCMYVHAFVCMYVGMYVPTYASHSVRTTHQSGCMSDGVSQHNISILSDKDICTTRILTRSGRDWASALLLVVNISPATIENPAPSPRLFP